MISNVYVNGIQVNTEKCRLQKIGNTSAAVEFSQYQRGGSSGQLLSRPLSRGMAIPMTWFVKGSSLSDFITQRDRLIGYFQNFERPINYTKTLGVELANGVIKEIDVVFSTISSTLEPQDIISDLFDFTAVSEKSFFTSREIKTAEIYLQSLGGMAIPMNIPMSMGNNPVGDVTVITNNGNTSAYPIMTIYGAFASGCTITNQTTSESFDYNDSLLDSDFVEIDFYNRTAVKNSVSNVLANVSGDWLSFQTGTNKLSISGGELDTGYAAITYKDTYRNI